MERPICKDATLDKPIIPFWITARCSQVLSKICLNQARVHGAIIFMIKKMNLNEKEIGQRFEGFRQKIGSAEIIESKSLLRMTQVQDNKKMPISHEKILFATIEPEIKVLSALGHFESVYLEQYDKLKEKTKIQRTMEL